MTKPQIWVAAFLAAFILLFILQKVTKKDEAAQDLSSQFNNQMTEESSSELTATQLISNFGCTNCHGSDLSGTSLGPALKNLSEYWSKGNLLAYLRNPNNYMDEERFKIFKEKYPGQIMPPYGNKNIKDLGKIVDYLLTQ